MNEREMYLQSIKLTAEMAQITNQGQIKGQQIKTQAEYDALPVSKLTDGVIYMIRG